MPDYTPKYLVMVTAGSNNNKYYRMIPQGDTWTAEYGRVGAGMQTRTYSKHQWDSKYNEKIRKGYVDQTDLMQDLISEEKPKKKSEYKQIENENIRQIVDRLQDMAKKAIAENYTVSANKVTQDMVNKAQDILVEILDVKDVKTFNDKLIDLFTVIPRKMGSVNGYIAKSCDDFADIIKREQDLLDIMKGQVVQKQVIEDVAEEAPIYDKTILEHLGLEFEECTADDIAAIKVALGSCVDKFRRAWRVKNLETQSRFDKFVSENNIKDVRLLFHGSRNENWWSIINTGLKLRPTNVVITGKLYGYGLYYAQKAQKSIGYTSLSGSYWARGSSNSGFMALMNVAYGVPYDVYDYNSRYGSLTYDKLQDFKPGTNCLHAHAGANIGYSSLRNDEIIVYKEEQCTIKYLVELGN